VFISFLKELPYFVWPNNNTIKILKCQVLDWFLGLVCVKMTNMKDHQYYVYIMTNQRDTVLYTGVTRDLDRRIWEHKNKIIKGFTKRYNIDKLIYYELYDDIEQAILREKQIKAGSRQKKIELIKIMNPNFKDLAKHL
tara:strand:- start:20606 stop:21019 length:414 start_codon:yes stop_codon:yes gene_type:complete